MSHHILLVDDDADMLRLLSLRLEGSGYRVTAVGSAEAALARLAIELPQLVITDIRLPERDGLSLFQDIRSQYPALPVILLTAHGTIPDAVEATTHGAAAYLTKPFDARDLLERVAKALGGAPPAAAEQDRDHAWRAHILSRSQAMATLLAEAKLVAASDASVLIRGESGTGKELLAHAVHKASPRGQAPFIAVNCGAIPEQLLESELFGHVKGAFTGAVASREGLLQMADGGTLFLDEIGDMPLVLQVKLLRVLQERTVRQVGSDQSRPIDVRIISATHRDLDSAMHAGQFREDLYYRLNVITLTLPSLAQRREDIALLANHFLRTLCAKAGKQVRGFAPDAMEALRMATWPGNVRQLHNVVEHVCALATGALVPLALVQRALRVPTLEVLSYAEAKQRFERNYLVQLLKLTDGNVSDAARLAERNRTEFYRLLQRYGLDARLFRADAPAPAAVAPERQA
ncbi:response regulator [Massilia arenosa]|uniref:Response regulator n=1 Tax=Zemynaea arenosa TaxID=2561931 RepID=A0A4Y9SQG7_9BURK|nr:sigma 54-interacting transcriptional regulator [Massilia arenosa]TFW28725.1 response regulator [Massilia arenosa]